MTSPAALQAVKPTATALLIINLGTLCENYRTLNGLASKAECAAVIKANAYGTGTARAAKSLAEAGCQTFFVATFNEALTVHSAVPAATVYVLDGYLPNSGEQFIRESIRPVLSSMDELDDWIGFCGSTGKQYPAALHVDTGMNRLGLSVDEAINAFGSTGPAREFVPTLLISHLACADQAGHPKNTEQLKAFKTVQASLPDCPASLANSGGIHLGADYHFDLVRAGFSLYGGKAVDNHPPLKPVVELYARIIQVHEAGIGESVGYGAPRKLDRKTRIATISLGYADGIFRNLGERAGHPGMSGYIAGHPAPVLGRVSMDLITLDVTDTPANLAKRGGWVEIIGPNITIDALAEQAGTIGYEVLTNLGNRAQRIYIDAEGAII